MAFTIGVGFATEQDHAGFIERIVPKLRAKLVDTPTAAAEGDSLHRLALTVTSQSGAKDICYQTVAYLAHAKGSRVTLEWTGIDGVAQSGDITAGEARTAETLALRIGEAARAAIAAEKA